MSFSEWAKMEVELPTLLDAAEAMTKAWFSDGIEGTADVIAEKICVLDDVIKREKSKPVRNCDRPECATTKAAQDVWRKEDGGKTAYYEWLLATYTKGGTDGSK